MANSRFEIFQLKIWDVKGKLTLFDLPAKIKIPTAFSWNCDGSLLAILDGKEIMIVARDSWIEQKRIATEEDGNFVCCTFSPNGFYILAFTSQNAVLLFELSTGSAVLKLTNFLYLDPP